MAEKANMQKVLDGIYDKIRANKLLVIKCIRVYAKNYHNLNRGEYSLEKRRRIMGGLAGAKRFSAQMDRKALENIYNDFLIDGEEYQPWKLKRSSYYIDHLISVRDELFKCSVASMRMKANQKYFRDIIQKIKDDKYNEIIIGNLMVIHVGLRGLLNDSKYSPYYEICANLIESIDGLNVFLGNKPDKQS